MEPFFKPDRLWPPGYRQLQLMILPDLERNRDFANLVAQCRKVMVGHAATRNPVPNEALHITVQPIHYPPGREYVDTPTRTRLTVALKQWFALVPAFEIQIGSPLVYHGGVVADTHYDDSFNLLLDRVRPVIDDVCGFGAASFDTRPAHMALCYANGFSSSDDLQRDLRHQVRPSHAMLAVHDIHLVETRQDAKLSCYTSKILYTFGLRD